MPLYEYHCQDCNADFEAITSFANADNVVCESCGGKRVERVASSFACAISGGGAAGATLPPCGVSGG
jgi:putative FmdB family regulatory protein